MVDICRLCRYFTWFVDIFWLNSWENDGKSQWLTMVHGRYMMIYVDISHGYGSWFVDIFHGRFFMGCNLHGM
jgi:hypothetical protein